VRLHVYSGSVTPLAILPSMPLIIYEIILVIERRLYRLYFLRRAISIVNAYEKKGLNTAAFKEYQKALSIDSNDADNNLGIAYYRKGLLVGYIPTKNKS